jgi:protein-tyrosine phosphatase
VVPTRHIAPGLKTVIDLRTNKEHDQSPTVWLGDNPPEFFHFPVGDANNDWFTAQRKMMKKNRFTQEQSLEHMVEGYRMIAEEGTSSYQKLMEVVLDESNWPVLIHCNAGKDRSGVGVALILEAFYVSVDERYGSMDAFLTELGVDQEARLVLAASLTP